MVCGYTRAQNKEGLALFYRCGEDKVKICLPSILFLPTVLLNMAHICEFLTLYIHLLTVCGVLALKILFKYKART